MSVETQGNSDDDLVGVIFGLIPITTGFFGLIVWGFTWDANFLTGSVVAFLLGFMVLIFRIEKNCEKK